MKKMLLAGLIICLSAVYAWSADNDVLTLKMLEELALSGDAEAGFILGGKYLMGAGMPQNDAAAVKWYGLAAEQGCDMAQFMLGNMYAAGSGVAQDNDIAIEWYGKAAMQGNAAAQLALAVAYMLDMTTNMGASRVYMWLDLTSQNGDIDEARAATSLMHVLGLLMTDGEVALGRQMAADWTEKMIAARE